MKAKLIFDMNEPDDRIEHQHAINGSKLAVALYDFDQWLRAKSKYENIENIDVDEVRDKLREFVSDNGLVFDTIIF